MADRLAHTLPSQFSSISCQRTCVTRRTSFPKISQSSLTIAHPRHVRTMPQRVTPTCFDRPCLKMCYALLSSTSHMCSYMCVQETTAYPSHKTSRYFWSGPTPKSNERKSERTSRLDGGGRVEQLQSRQRSRRVDSRLQKADEVRAVNRRS